jgi:hypothetical protein
MPESSPTAPRAATPVPAPRIQAKAHDVVLQTPVRQSADDLAWVEAVDGAWSRKPSARKHAGALSAVDQVLAGL